MGDFKIKPPAPLIRSNTHAGTLNFKRHHHRNHDERVRVAAELEMEDHRDTSSQPMSRKDSLQADMAEKQERERDRERDRGPSLQLQSKQQLEVSTAVRDLQETSKRQMQRLETTYSAVSRKLQEIRLMSEQLKNLGSAAEDVLREFDDGDMGCRKEFAAQIKGIERFQEELVSIQKLQERLGAEKMKVQAYRKRLENVQGKIDKQQEMELVWKQRASRRIRLLWGFISILVILWLLATAGNEVELPRAHETPKEPTTIQGVHGGQTSTSEAKFLSEGASREL
ncbi:hypothetical protein DFP73DRAFT_539292 [Morchella snyderi]|nr:hypothetical protein DFP73DRAFT_539292 [Morchella snyderi]